MLSNKLPWIIEQREAGVDITTLAQQLGIAKSTLWRFLQKHAPDYVSIKTENNICDAHASMIYAARQAGQSGRQIAAALGTCASTVNEWLRKHPVLTQKSQG